MSLPSKAKFYFKEDIIQTLSINCGWFYDGLESIIKIVKDIIHDYSHLTNFGIPESFDYVEIYGERFTKREFDILFQTVWITSNYQREASVSFDKRISFPLVKAKFPTLTAKDIINVQPLGKKE